VLSRSNLSLKIDPSVSYYKLNKKILMIFILFSIKIYKIISLGQEIAKIL